MIRLQKLLAELGLGSRRAIEEWIRAGRLTVNGRTAQLGDRAQAGDDVRLDGRRLELPREASAAHPRYSFITSPWARSRPGTTPKSGRQSSSGCRDPRPAAGSAGRTKLDVNTLGAAAVDDRRGARPPPHAPLERGAARVPWYGCACRPGPGRSCGGCWPACAWTTGPPGSMRSCPPRRPPGKTRATPASGLGAPRGPQPRGPAALRGGRSEGGEPAASDPLRSRRASPGHASRAGPLRRRGTPGEARPGRAGGAARPPGPRKCPCRAPGRPKPAPPKQITGQGRIDTPRPRNHNTRLVLRRGTQAANGSRL